MYTKIASMVWLLLLCQMATAQSNAYLWGEDSSQMDVTRLQFFYQQRPDIYHTLDRYHLISDLSNDKYLIPYNWKIQEVIETTDRLHLPFEGNLDYLRKLFYSKPNDLQKRDDKSLILGLWRTQLVNIQRDEDLPAAIHYGMDYLLPDQKLKWTNYLYFVTLLMEEHYDYHYDHQRVKPSMPSAGDVLGVADIFKTFRAYDTTSVAGVCRDIHDTGLRLLREMGNAYFSYNYPDKSIDMDDYLYLVSWVTQSSHHVTLIAQNPLSPQQQLELDWGRLIQKENIRGYDHGRNYGNVYRIWQYDKNTDWIRPIDFKKTSLGNVLDQRFYQADEKFRLSGIDPGESYTYASFTRRKNNAAIDLATGKMANDQNFTVLTFLKRWQNNRHFLQTSTAFALQALQYNDVNKKNVFYPGYNFTTSQATLVMPRLMAGIQTRPIRFLAKSKLSFFGLASLEGLVNAQHFISENQNYAEFTTSGDGGVYCTQGVRVTWPSDDKTQLTTLALQNRSFVIPKEIRLMTVDPSVLVRNLVWVNIARDLLFDVQGRLSSKYSYAVSFAAEQTQGNRFFGDVKARISYDANPYQRWSLMVGSFRRISSMDLFWYGPDVDSCVLSLQMGKPKMVFSLAGRRMDNRELNLALSVAYDLFQ
ncbi:MAG: hypothetical protein KBF57_13585 [Saprospiraceae bacterium]|jgi:hypothetical protein|nr:hypothetical protein [Saprospiraceae bacterium]